MDRRVALIIGGSAGLGLASAQALVKNGFAVKIAGRDTERLKRAQDSIGKGCIGTIKLDMANDAEISQFCLQDISSPDVLILNAGGPPPGPALGLNQADLEIAMQVHLYSSIRLVNWAVPSMVRKKFGRIVGITSITAKSPVENMALSNIVRGATQNWLKTLSREVASSGVTVNMALPGYTLTSRLDELFDKQSLATSQAREQIESKIISQIPAGRFGRPEEFGQLVSFLCSDSASFITGQAIAADGGWTKGI